MNHPYKTLPPAAFWRSAIGEVEPSAVDPVIEAAFQISPSDKVATAGSCFAQHIARHLRDNGFNFLVTEPGHPIAPPKLLESFAYGLFTARYGNIYTSRQLVQLVKRVYGEFQPADDLWERHDGALVDPFRPQIQPDGFSCPEEYQADRATHFAAVRKALEELDVFVFTLGLTECWSSAEDGAVYPLCPGVAGGRFDSARHRFVNLDVGEVVADLLEFIDRLRTLNAGARVILTVSPVPLVATASGSHVLAATTYSKSVLRVAAELVARARPDVAYFPSYEIITGGYSRGRYFAADCRSVTEAGVAHVMRLFLTHYTGTEVGRAAPVQSEEISFVSRMEALVEVACDEEALAAANM